MHIGLELVLLEQIVEVLAKEGSMDSHSETTVPPEANADAFHMAQRVCCGSGNSQDIMTTPPTSSSHLYFSAKNGIMITTDSPNTETMGVGRESEECSLYWSELGSNRIESDGVMCNPEKSNREIIEELRQLPKYQVWLNSEWETLDVDSSSDFALGKKLAEGGQAEIFEVENRRTQRTDPRYVLKVFKHGYSVRDLQSEWPHGMLECGFLMKLVVRAGMVLEDDRYACLLLRCHIDLRKLIDIACQENSPLWEAKRRPFQEFQTYNKLRPRSDLQLPKPIFKERCALNIMNHIAWGMLCLHNNDVLHRDLKSANVLCTDDNSNPHSRATLSGENQAREDRSGGRCISVDVADFEAPLGTVGTGFWRAPEILQQLQQLQQQVKEGKLGGIHLLYTPAADVYSYAMTCYEILTGCIPFEGCKMSDYTEVLRGVRPPLPDYIPSWVRDLVQKCWHQDPSERPSFSAIWQELRSRGSPPVHRNPVVLEAPDKSTWKMNLQILRKNSNQ